MSSRSKKMVLAALTGNDRVIGAGDESPAIVDDGFDADTSAVNLNQFSNNPQFRGSNHVDSDQNPETEPDPFSDSSESYHPPQLPSTSQSDSEDENMENVSNFLNTVSNTTNQVAISSTSQNMGESIEIRCKKRRNEKLWKRNVIKEKRNKGEEYTNYKNKVVPAKSFTSVVCLCKRKCSDHIPANVQENIHSKFYSIDWNGQTTWLCATVKISAPLRRRKRRSRAPSHKQHTRYYFLCDKQVCKSFFLKVLQISNKRLDYALTKKKDPETNMATPDKRGKKIPGNKIQEEDQGFIRQHIESIPRYVSHYGERTSHRQYLDPNLNLQKLYSAYVEKCQSDHKRPMKMSYYRTIFNTYNLHFYIPKKDTCKTCDIFQIQIQNGDDIEKCMQIKVKQSEHQDTAKQARSLMNSYKARVLDGSSCLITFDLERTLPTPLIQTGEVYYLRQLHTLNFGTHLYLPDGEKVTMNMWYETVAGRGSQEVISCLYYNIMTNIPSNISSLYTFSDSCTGQNRNWNLFFFMIYMVNIVEHILEITVTYLVSGHSFLPNDSDFSNISKAQKQKQHIYTPQEWFDLVQSCRKRNPFIVNNMVGKFVDFTGLEALMIKKGLSSEGNRVLISKMRKIKFCKNDSRIYFNSDYSEEYDSFDLNKEENTEVFLSNLRSFTPVQKEYNKPLTYLKFQDIKKMLHYVPPCHHQFYLSLPHLTRRRNNEVEEDEDVLPSVEGDEID